MKAIETQNFIFEYIWLDSDKEFRSKTKIMTLLDLMETGILESILTLARTNPQSTDARMLPIWNYDGSSTGQASTDDSEILLHPCHLFVDPFRTNTPNSHAFLVWCETYTTSGEPTSSNTRAAAVKLFEAHSDKEPWFGLEQEYFIINPKTNLPLGFELTADGILEPVSQGKYYCGVGVERAFGRELAETHMKNCLTAGVKICGINAEVAPSQWEYQIGICKGIEAADHLSISRYILTRTAEQFGLNINTHPKPLGQDADWNGSGCHTNFSTKEMREEGGLIKIQQTINKLSETHANDILYYGDYNQERLTGLHETSDYNLFTCGVANRKASVRIPHQVMVDKKGYFEDRRPAANCDPYLVTALIMKASIREPEGLIYLTNRLKGL